MWKSSSAKRHLVHEVESLSKEHAPSADIPLPLSFKQVFEEL
jgi:hypothetical protein